jgi:AcrR family transcriptional regulator
MASQPESLPRIDGRLARSKSSRAKIVAALLDLVGDGEISPSAARVADTAGVGLRSVFRHFDDMDSLYSEMSDHIEAKVLPIMLQPLQEAHWRDRVIELIERRVKIFETILPYRVSANIKRFQSDFVMRGYERMLRIERGSVESVLPAAVLKQSIAVESLTAALSFQTWRLLRYDQHLDVVKARAVMLNLGRAVLAQIPND